MAGLVKVTLPYTTGLPRDIVSHTWAFNGLDDTTAAGIGAGIVGFYNDAIGGGAAPIAAYLSPLLDRTTDACTIEFYNLNLATGETGDPFGSGNFTLEPTTATGSLPLEVAVCLSYNATPGEASSRASGRGRMFLGPLAGSVLSSDGVFPAVAASFIEDATNSAGSTLGAFVEIGAGWSVWSRKDHALYSIVGGWMDNEFDTVRSRGVDATSRTTWVEIP